MDASLESRLQHIFGSAGKIQLDHGIEKEALRISRDGYLSRKPHPAELGAALTHESITTDFSESQLEFVTRVHSSIDDCLAELDDIHRFVYGIIEGERLWPASMPCMLRGESSIPIADYGSSNVGRVKSIYRTGLAYRYGRYMQSISGLHYNFSIPDSLWQLRAESQGESDSREFRDDSYMSLIRNFRRLAWLPIYLFGSSPAVCGSFISTAAHGLNELDGESFYLPYATSLRMGPLGYQSTVQASHYISYNSLDGYVQDMVVALSKPYEPYEKIGTRTPAGEYKQLSTALLQIEAESYGTIRPKPLSEYGLRPIESLRRNGIEYLEVRCLDLNPFLRTGIDSATARFLDAMLIYCWLIPSASDSAITWQEIQENQLITVQSGRDPAVSLRLDGKERMLQDWALEVLGAIEEVCSFIDTLSATTAYRSSWEVQQRKVLDPDTTPSAQILARMKGSQLSYYRLIDSLANKHQREFLETPLSGDRIDRFEEMSRKSLQMQEELERSETQSFEQHLDDYMHLDARK